MSNRKKNSKNTFEGECVFVESNVSAMLVHKNGTRMHVLFQRFTIANEWIDLYAIHLKRVT